MQDNMTKVENFVIQHYLHNTEDLPSNLEDYIQIETNETNYLVFYNEKTNDWTEVYSDDNLFLLSGKFKIRLVKTKEKQFKTLTEMVDRDIFLHKLKKVGLTAFTFKKDVGYFERYTLKFRNKADAAMFQLYFSDHIGGEDD